MARRVKPPQEEQRDHGVRRTQFGRPARVATFRPGEPVPDAEYVRLVVPSGCSREDAEQAEAAARTVALAVKVQRDPAERVAVPDAFDGIAAKAGAHERSLRQVVLDRLERAEGIDDKDAVGCALTDVMDAAGL